MPVKMCNLETLYTPKKEQGGRESGERGYIDRDRELQGNRETEVVW